MRTWKAELRGRWNDLLTIQVAATTFTEAIKKVRQVARRQRHPGARFISLVQTAKLDA